jgi:peptidoglycan/LPS O-acetylase OafA/YrhL
MADGAYRPDIDGLRAIAVVGVLGYHAFPEPFKGTFTGVDIFFVISGFLITSIILSELRRGTFSFVDFYSRRIRRIFPALAVVLCATVAFGWYALTPYEYDQLGAHVAAGAGFVSNLLLWHESGYFDTESALKPLLHLWSLGIEEQYYLIWPLLLFLLRQHMDRILWLILAIAFFSFALNVALVSQRPEAAFYLPVTRFWELMLGGIAAYLHLHRAEHAGMTDRWRNVLAMLGIVLLILAFTLVRDGRGFPGWRALLPTFGTLFLIQAGPQAWINRRVLANRVMVYIGLISYPLYLWHWPILSYATNILGGLPPPEVRVGALALSGVLAWATYQLIEKPVRRWGRGPAAPRAAVTAATCVAALAGYGLLVANNYAQARSQTVPHLAEISAAYSDWNVLADGMIPGDIPEAVLFFGDSHMQQFLPRIKVLMQTRNTTRRTVLMRTRGGCAPIPGIERHGYQCAQFVDDTFALALEPRIRTVIISASWVGFTQRKDYYKAGDQDRTPLNLKKLSGDNAWVLKGFEAELSRLTAAGKHVVILLSSPFGDEFDPREMARRKGLDFHVEVPATAVPRSVLDSESAYIDDRIRQIGERSGTTVLSPLDSICRSGQCPVLDSDGKPVLRDDSHLRLSFVSRHFHDLDSYVLVTPDSTASATGTP